MSFHWNRSSEILNNMQTHEQNGQDKVRQNRQSTQTTINGKSMLIFKHNSILCAVWSNKILFVWLISDGEMLNQVSCNQTRSDGNSMNCNMTTTSAATSPANERMIQSPTHSLGNGAIHTISQPYIGDTSNFGPFYHHHHGQHHHIPSYPYDKYKSVHHARSPNTSPYDPYQSFYSSAPHHHQIVRPNGYIDLVPR